MSAYEPKHTNPAENPAGVESLWEKLREAGRKVLCSSMSVILAASLVPVMPTAVYAEEEEQQQQTQSDNDQQGDDQPTEGQEQPPEQPEQTPPPEGEPPAPEADQGEGAPAAGDPGTEGSEGTGNEQEGQGDGQDGQQQEEQQQEEAQQEEAQQEEVEQPAGNDGNKSENPSSGPASSSTSSGGDKGSNGNDSPKNDDQQKKEEEKKDNPDQNKQPDNPPTLTVQAVDAPTLEVGFSGEAPAAGQNYVSRSVVITVRGTQLSADGATASVTYDGAAGPIDAQLTGGGDSLTATVVLGPGTYTGVNASVANVKYGEGGSQTFNSDVRSLGGDAFTVVNPDAPTLKSIKLIKTGGSAEVPLNDGNQYVFAANEVQEIRVQVEDDALNLDDNTSFVEVLNAKGEQIAKQGFAGGDGTYTATISGVTGRIALRVKGASYGAESDQIKFFGGNADAGVADGSLVIDEKAPELTSIKIGEQVVTDDNPIYAPGQSSIVVKVADELLEEDSAISYACVLNTDDTAAVSNVQLVYDAAAQCYTAEVHLSALNAKTYKLKVHAKDKVHEAIELEYPLVIKSQSPEIQSVTIENEGVAAGGSYTGKQLVITVKDTALDTDGSQVMLTPVNGSETQLEGTWSQNAEAGTYTFTSADIVEGTYTIKIAVKDKAGNAATVANEFQNVTIDGDAPRIGEIELADVRTYGEGDQAQKIVRLNSGTATVTVTDLSFQQDKISISVNDEASQTVPAENYGVSWADSDGNAHTATITFNKEGQYTVTVSGEDAHGNVVSNEGIKSIMFIVSAEPTVVVTQTSTLDLAAENRYYSSPAVFSVSVTGKYIDTDATVVAGVKLSEIGNGTQGLVTFSDVSKDASTGAYSMKVTYNEGAHSTDLPVAQAKDLYLAANPAGEAVKAGEYAGFTVDCTDPTVSFAINASSYAYLGEGAGSKVLFFNKKTAGVEQTQLTYIISDNIGIKSVVMKRSDDSEQTVYDQEFSPVSNEMEPVVNLLEEAEFDDAELLEVTDLAGRTTTWSLNGTTFYPDTDKEVQSPTKLVEDHTDPELTLSGVEAGTHYTTGDKTVKLQIKEKNFEYLKTFAPNLVVLKVYRRENSTGSTYGEPVIQKTIGDEGFTSEGNDTYSITTDKLLQEGHYKVEAELTDLAGNGPTKASIGEFTIDSTPPIITAAYKDGSQGEPISFADGAYVQVNSAEGLIATITVDEHNFDGGLFTITAEKKDSQGDGDAFSFVYDPNSWSSNGDTHTYTIAFPDEGEYAIHVEGKDESESPAEDYDTTFHVDKTAPAVSMTFPYQDRITSYDGVAGEAGDYQEDETIYYDHEPVIEVTISDRYLDEGNTTVNGEKLSEILEHNSPYTTDAGIKYEWTKKRVWNKSRKQFDYALKMTYSEGRYDVNPIVQAKDKADRGPIQENAEVYGNNKHLVVDKTAPKISVTYKDGDKGKPVAFDDGAYVQVNSAEGLIATITVDERNFDGGLFTITAEKKDSQGDGDAFSFVYDPNSWSSDGDTHTYTIAFPDEGEYAIHVNGQDRAGHRAKTYDKTFHVDKAAPVVSMTFPYDDRTTGYDKAQGQEVTENQEKETIYFDHEPVVEVTVSARYLDEDKTTVNGDKLSEILEHNSPYTTDAGIKYEWTKKRVWNKSRKQFDYALKMTYSDGEYKINPIVVAEGRGDREPVNEDTNIYEGNKHLVVDTETPEILRARTTAAPKVNGNDSIYFFTGGGKDKGQAKHAIEFTVNDPHGIRSIELYDPSGRYKLYQSSARSALVKNKEAKFQIIDTLVDGKDFSDEVKVTITDFAGNRREWSMADGVLPDLLDTDGREMKHPSLLIEDNTDPVLTLSDIKENTRVDNKYKRYVNEAQSIHLTAAERTLKYLIGYKGFKGLDPTRTVLTVTYAADKAGAKAQSRVWPGATVTVSDLKDNGNDLDYYFDRAFKANGSEDGHYNVTAQLVDVVGNKSKKIDLAEFTMDTKAPKFTVTYTGAKRQKNANGKEYYNGPRTATIKVEEHNWDDSLFSVAIAKSINHAVSTKVKPSAWSHDGDIHTCTVSFSDDGEYQLKVSGKDKAGNEALLKKGSSVTKTKVYDSGVFVVDDEKPVIAQVYDNGAAPAQSADPTVEFPAPTGMYKGKSYYSHAIDVKTRVKDRNFDAKTTKVYRYHNGSEAKQDVTWSQLGSRRDLNGYEVYQASVNYTEDGDYQTPHVKFARDFANNQSENDPRDFVIDLVAPSISVSVDQNPTSTGAGNDQNDPIQFFNVATKMTFSMSDLHLLRSYTLDDPDGQYVIATTTQNVEGQRDATLVIELRDGANVANDTEYQRNITLTVQDLAGNQRMWTIDRTGKVVVDQTNRGDNNPANKSINDADVYPVALIQDTTAPYISLEGPAAGSYSNSTQHVRASVNEFNFEYLQRFDGSRVIMTVTKYEGNAGRAMSTWVVPASNFSGTRPSYGYDQPFEGDGHYSVVAEFLDYANNPSNRATVAEFTVDKTAPTISVTWTSPDGNAPYYRDTRVATITVVEHNFDPSLFAVTTTGARSGWSSNGDVHTMTITYANDGTYNLNITGRDRAGNEAVAYNGTQFVIDKTAPKITFGGRVQRYGVEQRDGTKENEYSGDITKDGKMPSPGEAENETLQDHHAYNGVVMPTIEFIDQNGGGQTNYNPSGVHYTITAGKHGRDTDLIDKRTIASATGGEIYQFEDFGLLVQNDSDDKDARNVYDPEADDVYTIKANMEDKAGNKAEGTVTFSVNRYGSNFLVTAFDGNGKPMEASSVNQNDGQDYDLVGEAPVIEVHEINVSGSESEKDHSVLKEYANAVDPIAAVKRSDKRKDGYELSDYDASGSASKYGWYEYVYTIRSGNFGSGSPSDSGDGGQGVYRVNVASIDRASNDTSSAEYLSTTDYEKASKDSLRKVEGIASSLKNATATFTLDQIAPFIDEFSVPNIIALGTSYTARVHVTDAITKGDTVKVFVDGVDKTAEVDTSGVAMDGTGTYSIEVPANFIPFSMHEVRVEASDGFASHEVAKVASERFLVTILVPEIAVIAAVVGAIVGGVVFYRKRKEVAEPETPGSY